VKKIIRTMLIAAAAGLLSLGVTAPAFSAAAWTSPNHYRLVLNVDPVGIVRRHSPASVELNLQQALLDQGGSGRADEHSIEVIAYNPAGQPAVFDSTRTGGEQYLLPWRIEKRYLSDLVTLSFVMPDETYTQSSQTSLTTSSPSAGTCLKT